jgi:hypothetical protein
VAFFFEASATGLVTMAQLPQKLVLIEIDARQLPGAPSNVWTVEQILA